MEYFIVDAFTNETFGGNPAGVCLVNNPLSEQTMQAIAAENNLAETAFLIPNGADYDIRWFTPEMEMDLCGHATLASAYVLRRFVAPDRSEFIFHSMAGELGVAVRGDLLEMDFPARPPESVPIDPRLAEAIGAPVHEAHRSRDTILLLDSPDTVGTLRPDFAALATVPDCFAVVVTAAGGPDCDFVSRYFAPGVGVPEDPVTGSSHASLVPFWAARLGRDELVAKQLSRRGGVLYCRNAAPRVRIAGSARLYLRGGIYLNNEQENTHAIL